MTTLQALPIPQLIFWFFSTLLILSAIMVVLAKQPVHSVLFLVFSFFASAVLWILLKAEFLALLLIFVYVGAVMTLFLFVIMLLNLRNTDSFTLSWHHIVLGVAVIAFFVAAMRFALYHPTQIGLGDPLLVKGYTVKDLAIHLYTQQIYGFECIGFLLLVAIVTTIAIVHRKKEQEEAHVLPNAVNVQMQANKANRLRIIDMQSESTHEKE